MIFGLKIPELLLVGVLVWVSLFSFASVANEKCGPLLPEPKMPRLPQSLDLADPTGELITYLTVLEDNDILGAEEIQRFAQNLENNILENPISEKLAALNTAQKIHREGLETYFSAGDLDIRRLKAWTQRNLVELETEEVERDEVQTKTDSSFQEITFYPVTPKPFKMGPASKEKHRVLRNLAQPFEMMSTPVTQYQWTQLMKKNPARFVDGGAEINLSVDGAVITLQPDHPMERITWWSAVIFANKLSVAKGLKPAYILDESAVEGDAAQGTATSKTQLIRYNSSTGSVYDTEGYRLPTETEQEFVLRAGGVAQGKYFFGDDVSRIEEHAWFNRNADQRTQAVGQKPPIIIDGYKFFDVLGNVEEWSSDWFAEALLPGTNLTGPTKGKERVIRGGSWITDLKSLESTTRWFANPDHPSPLIGFRLVRSLKAEPANP